MTGWFDLDGHELAVLKFPGPRRKTEKSARPPFPFSDQS